MECCFHIWIWSIHFLFSNLDWIQNHWHGLVDGENFFNFSAASFPQIQSPSLLLLVNYFHGKYSNEFHSLISLVQIFTARTYHATSMELNHFHFFCFLNAIYSESFLPRTLLYRYFFKYFNPGLFTSPLFLIVIIFISYHVLFHSYHTTHSVLSFWV